jgi:hypothetical protein
MNKFGRILACGAACLGLAPSLFAAEVTIPRLELATFGKFEGNLFTLASLATADVAITGGFKFGGALNFAFASSDLERMLALAGSPPPLLATTADVAAADYNALAERLANTATLGFRLAQVTVREPLSLPIELSYFIGHAAVFGSGEAFASRFGTEPLNTAFRGFAYFPQGIGGDPLAQYDGIHAVNGTGFAIADTAWQRFVPQLYVYQDSAMAAAAGKEGGFYSADLRFLANGDRIKFEGFVGTTQPYCRYGLFRAGAFAYLSATSAATFMAQIGVPQWDPIKSFTIDNLFILFEPRVDFGFTSITITLFYHPSVYLQAQTGEKGAVDVNFKLLLGDLREMDKEGGIEASIGLKSDNNKDEPFALALSPFFGLVAGGVRWDFKVKLMPVRLFANPLTAFETYMGVRTAY